MFFFKLGIDHLSKLLMKA